MFETRTYTYIQEVQKKDERWISCNVRLRNVSPYKHIQRTFVLLDNIFELNQRMIFYAINIIMCLCNKCSFVQL